MRAVIFDFDGTIADTLAFIKGLNELVSEEYGRQPLSDRQIGELRKMTFAQALRSVNFPTKHFPKLFLRLKQLMAERINRLEPVEGMIEVINELAKTDGLVIGLVSSNNKDNVHTFLEKHAIKDKFNFINVGAALFAKQLKLRQALRSNRLRAKDCIYVGDEIRDIEAARRAGMKVAAVSWGLNHSEVLASRKPEWMANKPQQLVKIVRSQL